MQPVIITWKKNQLDCEVGIDMPRILSSCYFINFLQAFMANGWYIFCLTVLFKVAFSEQPQFSQPGPLFFQKKESSHNWVTLVTEWFKHVTCLLVVPKSVKLRGTQMTGCNCLLSYKGLLSTYQLTCGFLWYCCIHCSMTSINFLVPIFSM